MKKDTLTRPEMFEIIKDFMGWTLIDKHNNKNYYNFLNYNEAVAEANKITKELYQGSGVVL
jgi:pterin-4a-carbinolamine dehydratase